MRRLIIGVPIILIVIGLGFWLLNLSKPATVVLPKVEVQPSEKVTLIGKSVQNRDINAYSYGTGSTTLVFVGGIHGGYEWNSVLLAYKFMDYLKANPNVVPKNITVTIIPSVNPDGVYKIIGKEGRFTVADIPNLESMASGRFNANNVDLNRNFACHWQATSTWQSKIVSAGTSAFSEPESKAFRDFALKIKPAAVVFWHSQANAVYASECYQGISTSTLNIMTAYSKASGYPPAKTFDSYVVTGDSSDWLASVNIPAITVELKTHETIEWEKNLAGVQALFKYFAFK